MTEEEEEAAHIEELRDAARKMGAEARRRALEAGIDINRPQLGQRKTVRVDPSRWSRRQSYHVPAAGPMPVAPELAAAAVTLELTGDEAMALGLALEIAIREARPASRERDPGGWEGPGILKWKRMLASQVGALEAVHAKLLSGAHP